MFEEARGPAAMNEKLNTTTAPPLQLNGGVGGSPLALPPAAQNPPPGSDSPALSLSLSQKTSSAGSSDASSVEPSPKLGPLPDAAVTVTGGAALRTGGDDVRIDKKQRHRDREREREHSSHNKKERPERPEKEKEKERPERGGRGQRGGRWSR